MYADETIIERVRRMELYFDTISRAVREKIPIYSDPPLKAVFDTLIEYYDSGQWLSDYQADERGELPHYLRRGVLSEDGVYNLLSEIQEKGENYMTHKEKANQYFSDKFHCSQAVLASFAEELGITEEQALKLGACFGSGMRKGEVCGACTGALMVLGLKYGHFKKADMESRSRANTVNDRFLDEFRKRNGSYICNELLECDISTPEGAAYAIENKLFTDFCPKMVASAVEIIEDIDSDVIE